MQQDPIVSQVKLIAEPWDLGPGGYQVGNFPPNWSEWNGKFRDTIRDFWRGEPSTLGEFASRLTWSSDLYGHSGRRPMASINFVTAHDGFTLADLVAYNRKHNEANGESNADGESNNRSWNGGAEGPTGDPAILRLRSRRQRSLIATLLLSQGIPMILHGDEMGRTQHGNNNAYAQDSQLSWINWESADKDLLDFAVTVSRLRAAHPTFHRRRFFRRYEVRAQIRARGLVGGRDLRFHRFRGLPLTAPLACRLVGGATVVPHVKFGRSRLMFEHTFIGLDVHAVNVVGHALTPVTGEILNHTMASDPAVVLEWVRRFEPPVKVVYESGPTGFVLARYLRAAGIDCVVAASSKLSRAPGDRVKTDVLTELARATRGNRLRSWLASATFCFCEQRRERSAGTVRAGGAIVGFAGGNRQSVRTVSAG